VLTPSTPTPTLCQGADTVIYERLDPNWELNATMREVTTTHMEEYGSAGLRTLCLAWAPLDPEEYDRWGHGGVCCDMEGCAVTWRGVL
jgi:phospholipid-translocating ATPase